MSSDCWGPIITYLIEQFDNVKIVDSDLTNHNQPAGNRLFWLGFLNRLRAGPPSSGFNFSVTIKKPQTLGRACADAEIFAVSMDKQGSFDLIPDSVKTGGRGKILTSRAYELLGMSQKVIADRMLSAIAKTISRKFKGVREVKTLLAKVMIPVHVLTNRVVRKHSVKRKIDGRLVDVSEAIHLNRPSKTIECITEQDKRILKSMEGPWDELKRISDKHVNGVSVTEASTFIEEYKIAYNAQFEITSKLSGWRASRRQLILAYAPMKGKKAVPYKPRDAEKLIMWANQVDPNELDFKLLDSLNPRHLERINQTSDPKYDRFLGGNYLTSGILRIAKKSLSEKDYDGLVKYYDWVCFNTYLSLYIGQDEAAEQQLPDYINKASAKSRPTEQKL
jgi:hypothetical protein